MATINTQGISIKTVQQWKTLLEGVYKGVDPEWDVSTNSPDGQIIAAFSEMLANVDEAILDSYNAADPDKAHNEALDAIMRLSNTERKEGTYSIAVVELSGINTTVVPAGTLIENAVTGTQWAIDSDTTIGATATAANVTCAELGPNTASAGELTKIATPVTGLQSVTNATPATLGRNVMSNTEARLYREQTISNRASNNIDSIYSAVAAVEGVTAVATYNNRTDSVDSNGLPARSFSVICVGGTDAHIAAAIYSKLLPGPAMFGGSNPVNEVVTSEETNNSETVTFGRASAVPLHLEVNIKEVGDLPANIETLVKDAIVSYSVGTLFDNDISAGNRKEGFKIGEDISSGMLHTPVNYIIGALAQGYVESIFIDTSPSPTAAGVIVIGWEEIATVDGANITVNVT